MIKAGSSLALTEMRVSSPDEIFDRLMLLQLSLLGTALRACRQGIITPDR